jgi:formiminoglutamase
MELACRAYLDEPVGPVCERDWPTDFDPLVGAPMRGTLMRLLDACVHWTSG